MEKQETIFRQKSIDRINSPEQLDNYLKVTSPSIWLILVGIIVILLGAIVWSTFGELKTYVDTACIVENGNAHCYIQEEKDTLIKVGMTVEIPKEDYNFEIATMDNEGVVIPNTYNYLQHLLGVTENDYVFGVHGICKLNDGFYSGRIVAESISPLEFIFN